MPVRFQVDPDFYDHPKAIGMSDSATALWVRAGSYSAAKLTDGFVAEAALILLSRCPDEAASELVARRLSCACRTCARPQPQHHPQASERRACS